MSIRIPSNVLAGPVIQTVATVAPTAPVTGAFWFDTSVNNLKVWNGSAWVVAVPPSGGGVATASLPLVITGSDIDIQQASATLEGSMSAADYSKVQHIILPTSAIARFESANGAAFLAGYNTANLSANLYNDGGSNQWMRYDTARQAKASVLGEAGWVHYHAPSGANPAALTAYANHDATRFNQNQIAIGQHPTYGASYSAIWNVGSTAGGNYAMLQTNDGNTTLLNGGTSIAMRVANTDKISVTAVDNLLTQRTTIGAAAAFSGQILEVVGQIETQYGANRASRGYLVHDGSNCHLGATVGAIYVGWNAANTIILGGPVTIRASNGVNQNLTVGDISCFRSGAPTTGVLYFRSDSTRYLFDSGTAYVMPNQNLTLNGVNVNSSRALKDGIADLADGALATINKLRPRSFFFKTNPSQQQRGFILEEVEPVLPETVSHVTGANEGEEFHSLDYNSIFTLGIKAIQELSAKVAALEARIAVLEGGASGG